MKNRKTNIWGLTGRSSQWLGACSIAVCFLTAGHAMAQLTWTGGTSTAWNDSGNWLDTATLLVAGVPTDGTILNFGGATYSNPGNMPINNDIAPLTTGAINFVNNGVVASFQNTPFTLGAADLSQSITLGGNITTSIDGAAPTVGFTDTINLNLVLDAPRIINTNNIGNRSHNVNIVGAISEVSPGPFGLSKGGGAGLGLANTANSFSGDMTISGGTVSVNSLQPSGVNSSIGKGSVINLGGTLTYNTVAGVGVVAPAGNIDRAINLTASGAIGIEPATYNFTFSGTFTNVGETSKTFTLTGNAGSHQFQGNLVNNGDAGILSVTKGSFGTWTLTGNNTYTGETAVNSGGLTVANIADSTTISNMGYGTKFKLGGGVQTGTLNYIGNDAETARQLTIGGLGTAGTGGATINANGTNGGDGLRFTNPAFNLTTTDIAATRTLNLSGTNTDANEIVGIVIDGNTNLKTALSKSGAGLWILSGAIGANTYTGINTVSGGTLQVNRATGGLGDSIATNAVNLNGGTLSLRNDGAGNDGTIIYGGTSNAAGYNVQLSATSTINAANLTANTGNTIQLGPLTQATAASRTLNVTGSNGYRLTLPSLGLNPLLGQTTTLSPTTASLIITGNVTNPMSGFTSINYDTLALAGSATGNRIDGVISDAVGASPAAGGLTRITKSGDSTWELAGNNINTGIMTISAGTLLINGDSSVANGAVAVNGGTLGGVGTLGGAVTVAAAGSLAPGNAGVGILTLNSSLNVAAQAAGTGKLNFELGPVATSDKIVVSGPLTIGPASPALGVLGFSDFNFSALPGLVNDTYTLITGASSVVGELDLANLTGTIGAGPAQGALQFNGNALELVVTGAGSDPYTTWSLGAPFAGDANNDGVENGLAWLLGAANPNVNALGLLPKVTQLPGGGLQLTFNMLPASARDGAKLTLQHSSNLGISDTWASVLVPDATGGAAPVTFTVSGINPLAVTATIASSEAAAGKLFGRLKAER